MMAGPNKVRLVEDILDTDTHMKTRSGRWIPARWLGSDSIFNRLKLAWMVFKGEADALVWPEGE